MDESINDNEFSLLEVLIPYNKFQFFSIEPAYISDRIKERIYASNINMDSFCLKPKWMQEEDYEVLTAHLNKKSIVFENVSDHDYESFFKSWELMFLIWRQHLICSILKVFLNKVCLL